MHSALTSGRLRSRIPPDRNRPVHARHGANQIVLSLVRFVLIALMLAAGPAAASFSASANPATPEAAAAPVAEAVWQATGDPAQRLDHPTALAIDSAGNL